MAKVGNEGTRRGARAGRFPAERRVAQARALLGENWSAPAPRHAIVAPATAFLAVVASMIAGGRTDDPLGRLKALLLGPALPRAFAVAPTWDAGYLIEHLRDVLPPGAAGFLAALLAAINDPAQAAALDRFEVWRQVQPVPPDIPWPEA